MQVEEPYELRRHPEPVRSTLLAAWAALRSGELTDNLIEVLMQTIERIDTKSDGATLHSKVHSDGFNGRAKVEFTVQDGLIHRVHI